MDNGELTKACCTCKQQKPVAEFYRNRRASDGLDYCCKACISEKRKTPEYKNKKSNITKWADGTMKLLNLKPGDY